MKAPSLQEVIDKIIACVEFAVYIAVMALAAIQADMITQYILGGLIGFAIVFMVGLRQPLATHILLCYPLLCVAHDFGHLYYALSSSVVAALCLYTGLKDKLAMEPWKLAAGALLATLSSLGLSHPAFDMVLQAPPVQMVMNHPYGKLAIGAGFGIALQWITMQYFVNAAGKSFHNVEAALLSQLAAGYMTTALGNLTSPGKNEQAVVLALSVLAWLGFWFFEFFSKSPFSTGVKFSIVSSIAVIIANFLYPIAPKYPPAFLAFVQEDINWILMGYWAACFLSFSTVIALIQKHVSNTVARKGFHFMALAMFLPAMIVDPRFLRIALSFAIALFCLVEFIRSSNLLGQKISQKLTQIMNAVMNDRDRAGPWTLSHLYLLIGCGFALLYAADADAAGKLSIDVMAGPLLVLAVGDSFASIVGHKWGKLKWRGSERSVLGTLAGISTTLGAMFALCTYTGASPNWIAVGIVTVCTFIIEIYVQALDNLVLPIFYYSAMGLLG